MLHGNVFVSLSLRIFFCGNQYAVGVGRNVDAAGFSAGAGDDRNRVNRAVYGAEQRSSVYAHLFDERADQPAVLIQQRVEQVLRMYLLILIFQSYALGCLYGL